MICEYCRSEGQTGENCQKCGANLPTAQNRGERFFYNGYMCYVSHNCAEDAISVYFFLGERLAEVIKIPYITLREFVPEGCEFMPFFYELLKVQIGEVEVCRVQEMNKPYPAMFESRKIENQYLQTFSEHIRTLTDR